MKRLMLAALCATRVAAAQGWEGGLKGGVSHIAFDRGSEFSWEGGHPTAAAFVGHSIAGPLSLQIEAAHARRVGVSSLAGSTLTMRGDYLDFPILARLRFPDAGAITPFVVAGPSFALRLSCRLQFVGGSVNTNDDCETARGTKSQDVDIGLVAGAGVGITTGVTTLVIEGRRTAGLLANTMPIDDPTARTSGWAVMLGVSVPLYARRLPIPVVSVDRAPERISTEVGLIERAGVRAQPDLPRVTDVSPQLPRVTIKAVDADAASLIAQIAKTANLSVSIAPDVHTRVSVALFDVPARDAIQAIADVSGLMVVPSASTLIVYLSRARAASAVR